MKKLLAALLYFALSSAALAQSSYTFKDAGGTTQTVKSINCTTICPMTVPVDSLGVPIWGTAGAANSNVMSVQGVASGTPIPISVGTVTVTGTVTANLGTLNGAATAGNQTTLITNLGSPFQAGASIGNTSFAVTQPLPSSLNATVVGTGTFATQLTGATNNINNIAGTISLPTGAATAVKQPALGTAGSSSTDVISIQGIASGTAVPVSGTVSIAANQSVNVAQIAGTATATGSGVMNAGTQRTALATDSPGIITLGQTTMSASVPVTIASDQSALTTTATSSAAITNPSSTLTMPATTTAYTAGQLIATSATAGSVVNPSFAIATSAGGGIIPRLRISSNDTTSTAWGSQTIQVDIWAVTPTWTNGDRGTWLPATGAGAGSHIAAYTCVMGAVWGDGVSGECVPVNGNFAAVRLASGTSIFWSLQAVTGSGVTGASKVFTVVAEILN